MGYFDKIIHYNEIDSTCNKAKQLILNGEISGNFLIIAESQTGGKGRNENKWYSPPGGLWITAGLYNLPLRSSVTIYTGLCIIKAINKLYPKLSNEIGIKWPNDIYLQGKKAGGILTLNFPAMNYLLIGIGINTNNDIASEIKDTALSLSTYLQKEVLNDELINSIFEIFFENLVEFLEDELKGDMDYYCSVSILEQKRITLATDFQQYEGIVRGITKQGAIRLLLDNGSIQPFISGTVEKF